MKILFRASKVNRNFRFSFKKPEHGIINIKIFKKLQVLRLFQIFMILLLFQKLFWKLKKISFQVFHNIFKTLKIFRNSKIILDDFKILISPYREEVILKIVRFILSARMCNSLNELFTKFMTQSI